MTQGRGDGRLIHVRLVGEFRVEHGGRVVEPAALGSRKARTLLKLLASRRPEFVPGDEIVAALWDGDSPADAAAVVASLVSRLRRTLGPDVVAGGRAGYRLGGPPTVQVDLDQAQSLADEAERRLTADEPALAAAAAAAAQRLLGDGSALADEPDAGWAEPVREELSGLRRRVRHAAATAGLVSDDLQAARAAATSAVRDDPLDETGARLLMAAALAAGETAAALTVYERLRGTLGDDLGIDPAPATQALYLAALRGEPPPAAARSRPPPPTQLRLAGRDEEFGRLRTAWGDATRGVGQTVLVIGEAGIGKTRLVDELADLARRTGGTVLTARCYEAERSLFVQPVVDALTDAVTHLPAARLREAADEHAGSLVRLIPDLGRVLTDVARERSGADIERRRAFEAVAGFLRGLGRHGPILLLLDDLQHAGRSTLELIHFLGRRADRAALLVLATVREDEGAEALVLLVPGSSVVALGPLSADAVAQLAAGAGLQSRTGEILRRTGGHTLFVVETLRALGAGEGGIPESLQAAVIDRVHRVGDEVERVLRAGAVLGSAFDPGLAGRLIEVSEPTALTRCERALTAGLLVVAGREYEFAHDLVREVLLETTPEPTRLAHHRRAADLLAGQPESVAAHASAAGDRARAGRAWLLAADQAMARYAVGDAHALATRALAEAGAVGYLELQGRALIVRGRADDARAEYGRALTDFELAQQVAREAGDRRLEMIALRQLAGDVPVALGRPPAVNEPPLRACLALAESLGDRTAEADILGRLSVLACSHLGFTQARDLAARALAAARASGDDGALAWGLDAVKTAHAYLGEVAELAEVIAELEPLLRRRGELWLLQWTVFEGSFVWFAAQDWPAAAAAIERALAICRRSGYTVHEPFYIAYLGWAHRLAGEWDDAIAVGRRAVEMADTHRHSWWSTTAASLFAGTLLAAGRASAAVTVLEEAREAADVPGAEAYLLRCLGPLAEASGSAETLAEADALLRRVDAPPGTAWLLGADAYLSIARAWRAAGDTNRAAAVLRPFRAAADRAGWPALVRLADEAG